MKISKRRYKIHLCSCRSHFLFVLTNWNASFASFLSCYSIHIYNFISIFPDIVISLYVDVHFVACAGVWLTQNRIKMKFAKQHETDTLRYLCEKKNHLYRFSYHLGTIFPKNVIWSLHFSGLAGAYQPKNYHNSTCNVSKNTHINAKFKHYRACKRIVRRFAIHTNHVVHK